MKLKRVLLGLTILFSVGLLLADKKPKTEEPPIQTFPTSQTFLAPCFAIWPIAVTTLMAADMQIHTSDRQGGLLTFRALQEYAADIRVRGRGQTELMFRSFTTARPEMMALSFRIPSGTLALVEMGSGCTGQFSIQFQGVYDMGYRQPRLALDLPSSGQLENRLLSRIASQLTPSKP